MSKFLDNLEWSKLSVWRGKGREDCEILAPHRNEDEALEEWLPKWIIVKKLKR